MAQVREPIARCQARYAISRILVFNTLPRGRPDPARLRSFFVEMSAAIVARLVCAANPSTTVSAVNENGSPHSRCRPGEPSGPITPGRCCCEDRRPEFSQQLRPVAMVPGLRLRLPGTTSGVRGTTAPHHYCEPPGLSSSNSHFEQKTMRSPIACSVIGPTTRTAAPSLAKTVAAIPARDRVAIAAGRAMARGAIALRNHCRRARR